MTGKPPPSHMLDYVELYLLGQIHEKGITRADVARALGVNKSTISRHFDLDASYSRDGGVDAYVGRMAALLGLDPLDVWRGATAMWEADNGKAPARRRRQVAARRRELAGQG